MVDPADAVQVHPLGVDQGLRGQSGVHHVYFLRAGSQHIAFAVQRFHQHFEIARFLKAHVQPGAFPVVAKRAQRLVPIAQQIRIQAGRGARIAIRVGIGRKRNGHMHHPAHARERRAQREIGGALAGI